MLRSLRQCLPLTFVCLAWKSVAQDCRSNETHIAWRVPKEAVRHHHHDDDAREHHTATAEQAKRALVIAREEEDGDDNEAYTCVYQNATEAARDAYEYLRQHVMPFDLPFLETLGFHDDSDNSKNLPDGLEQGMIGLTIDYALRAKREFNYTDALPQEIWQEYVLNYANTNEARSNWRPLFWQKLRPLVKPCMTNNISAVVHVVNAEMWKLLAPAGSNTIEFKGGSTPLIFDPMSILAFGYASCTGCSILLVNALRTLGVPARLAGTAAWWQDPLKGNHNWVEVWKNGRWYFLEPSPGQSDVDDLERPPHQRWFCQSSRFGPHPHNTTLVYAARLDSRTSVRYPVAWEPTNHDVPGEDVSEYYRKVCGPKQDASKD